MSQINRKIQVVMLETTDATSKLWSNNKDLFYYPKYGVPIGYIPQHFYFLSDDEIKEGDYILISTVLAKIKEYQPKKVISIKNDTLLLDNNELLIKELAKKIIATTNPELKVFNSKEHEKLEDVYILSKKTLPRPSDKFIQKFIEEYNKGNVITEVMVEYEGFECTNGHYMDYQDTCTYPYCDNPNHNKLKVAPDNTITIHPILSKNQFHLQFLHDRLINVHGENENYDYMIRLRDIIKEIK